MIEDATILDESISEAFLNGVLKNLTVDYFYFNELPISLIDDLYKENPEARESLLYNDKICIMNRYIPDPAKPSQFYVYHGASYGTSSFPSPRIRHTKQTKTTSVNKLPCSILLENVQSEVIDELLGECAKMNQDVQHLHLSGDFNALSSTGDIGNDYVHASQLLKFAPGSTVNIRNLNFCQSSMRLVMNSLKVCTTLKAFSLYSVSQVPDELYASLCRNTGLKVLSILQSDVPSALPLHIKQLKHLENLTISDVHRSSDFNMSLLHALRACPLRLLSFELCSLSGVFDDAFKNGSLCHEHLEILHILFAELLHEDLQAIRNMIDSVQTPKLKDLSLWGTSKGNDSSFRNDLVSILEAVYHKLPDCVVHLGRSDLPSNFDSKQYERCLRLFRSV